MNADVDWNFVQQHQLIHDKNSISKYLLLLEIKISAFGFWENIFKDMLATQNTFFTWDFQARYIEYRKQIIQHIFDNCDRLGTPHTLTHFLAINIMDRWHIILKKSFPTSSSFVFFDVAISGNFF